MYFCNKKFELITKETNNDLYRELKTELTKNFNISYNEKYEIFEKNHNIDFSKYLMTTKENNNLYLFLITINNIKYSVFYNEKQNEFYSVKMRFHRTLYSGTLIKGNIIKNKKDCWIYYLSDIFYYKGSHTNRSKLSQRIKMLAGLIKNEYVFDDFMNPCHLQLKSYFLLNHVDFIKNNNEFLFIPEYNNMLTFYIKINNKIEIMEQIGGSQNNKIFKIINTDIPDVYELYENNKFHSIACVAKFKTSKMLKSLFKNRELNKDIFVECEYSQNFNSWVPIKSI
jgi:hypothetical protein